MLHRMVWDRFQLDLGSRACIMGVLNTTPDSFSDGGLFFSFDDAVAQGLKLVEDGAHILDIGGESTRPFSDPVSAEQEMERVVPVIEKLAQKIPVPISIDTSKASVARAALDAGAAMINDITALEKDPEMAQVAAERNVPVVLMHMRGTPKNMQVNPDYADLITEITGYLSGRIQAAEAAGIQRNRIIVDPGIGFGKTVEHNLMLIKHLDVILGLGCPVLMGVSRKSFIQKILSEGSGQPMTAGSLDTELGTLGAVAACLAGGAHIVRVHDVSMTSRVTAILDAVKSAG